MRPLSDADRALGELSGQARTMANPHLLLGPFMRREAVLSSRIEGTQADLLDLYAYEAGQLKALRGKAAPPESDVREVLNYVRAMEYGVELLKTLPVTLRFIRELHERLMEGVRGGRSTPGESRRSQNWIGAPGSTLNGATYVPPSPAEMLECLYALEKSVNGPDDGPPLVRLALVHYQFEAIHPFLDGNGRIGRLLISLLLVHWDLLPSPLLYLSAFFGARRGQYYDLLRGVSERGAWRDWVAYFLEGVAHQSRDVVERARCLQHLQIAWREQLIDADASARVLRLADHLFVAPVVTAAEAQRVLGVTPRSSRMSIDRLVRAGILRETTGAAYGRTYVADAIMAASGMSADLRL